MKKRKGIALIWVVLISVLVFVSIIGIYLKIVPEKNISLGRTSSTRAIAAAEGGLSQVIFDIRSVDPVKEDWIEGSESPHIPNLMLSEILSVLKDSTGNVVINKTVPFDPKTPNVTYEVKLRKNTTKSDSWDLSGSKSFYLDAYILGTVYKDVSKNEVLARKAIATELVYTINVEESLYKDYALYSECSVTVGGSAEILRDIGADKDANIYGAGSCDNKYALNINGQPTIEGTLYLPTGKSYDYKKGIATYIDQLPPLEINIELMKDLADKFKTGAPPYDGSGYDFNNDGLKDPTPDVTSLISIIQNPMYLGPEGSNPTLEGIFRFYQDLKSMGGLFAPLVGPLRMAAMNLASMANAIVYYHQGEIEFPGGTLPVNAQLEGILVIEGNLGLRGQFSINYEVDDKGKPTTPNNNKLAIVTTNNLSIDVHGQAKVNALLLSKGNTDINAAGTFEITGSILAEGEIKFNAGTLKFNYSEGLYDWFFAPVISTGVNQSSNTWKEISFDEFQNP
jgi:hypothetical protein